MLSFMYATSARTQEICDIKAADILISDRIASG